MSNRCFILQTGQIAQQLTYDTWGNITQNTNTPTTQPSATTTDNNFQPFAYTGGLYDEHTKLTRLGSRDYDPTIGRFLTPDQLGLQTGTNSYNYVNNDPINNIDPTGHSSIGCFQDILSMAGAIPGPIGAVFDMTNALIYLAEGDYTNAALSVAFSFLPIPMGVVSKASRATKNATRSELKTVRKASSESQSSLFCPMPAIGAAATGKGNSFTPQTQIQLADGTTKDIQNINVGDKVLSTDPQTGKTSIEPVTDVIKGQGTKELVDVTLDSGQTVTATNNHLFYVSSVNVGGSVNTDTNTDTNTETNTDTNTETNTWVEAKYLKPGDHLLSDSAGVNAGAGGASGAGAGDANNSSPNNAEATSTVSTTPTVVSIKTHTEQNQIVYNLTIANTHTYYVVTGDAGGGVSGAGGNAESALVHNGDSDKCSAVAKQIANGHAFDDHTHQFSGIKTREGLAELVDSVINDPTALHTPILKGGRTLHFRDGVLVALDLGRVDNGTIFIPDDGIDYFFDQWKRG